MRGHIVKRAKDSYSIAVNLGVDATTGKRKQHWETVKGTKRDAERRLASLLTELDAGAFVKPDRKVTLGAFLTRWITDYVKPNLSPRSIERYSAVCKDINATLGHIPLSQLKPAHLQGYYAAKMEAGCSSTTARYHHAILHKALKTALKQGAVTRNVADAVDAPRVQRTEMQTWNEEELARFLTGAKDSPYYALFYLYLFTGARRSELLALTWRDVDMLAGEIRISRGLHQLKDNSFVFTGPKSAKGKRSIALPPSAIMVLRDHKAKQEAIAGMMQTRLGDDDLVFSTVDGQPLRPNSITRAWSIVAARANVKHIRLHDARHTHASLMLKDGVHPKVVQERLGHSGIQITLDRYSHLAPGLQQAAAQGFDRLLSRPKDAPENSVSNPLAKRGLEGT